MTILQPAENLALTVARAQVSRGVNPDLGVTTMLVLTLDRLAGAKPVEVPPLCDACEEADPELPLCDECLATTGPALKQIAERDAALAGRAAVHDPASGPETAPDASGTAGVDAGTGEAGS